MSTNLSIYQGDDYAAVVTITDGTGGPANLTGYSARVQIRRSTADRSAEICTMTTQITGSNVVLTLSHTITATLTGSYRWDLELTAPSGVISTPIGGAVLVTPEITRLAS